MAIPFPKGRIQKVEELIEKHGKQVRKGGALRDRLRDQGIHFLSLTSVEGERDHPAHLIIESSHDGEKKEAIKLVADRLEESLKEIFAEAGILTGSSSVEQLLERHSIDTGIKLFSTPGLNHRGVPRMSVGRIKAEGKFAAQVRDMVACNEDRASGASPLETLEAVRDEIRDSGKYPEMLELEEVPFLAPGPEKPGIVSLVAGLLVNALLTFCWPFLIIVGLVCIYVGKVASDFGGVLYTFGMLTLTLIAAALVLLVVVGVAASKFLKKERADEGEDSTPDSTNLGKIQSIENDGDNNHLFGVYLMKPGRLRRAGLKLAFWGIAKVSAPTSKPGHLGSLGTIHFARWVLLPGTDQLLFYSNYSGSWESYLEDFITKASVGLTAVWSNTYGFPKTSNLIQMGATDGDRFKRWARRQQKPSLFWYSAYPNKTTPTIRLNAAIRYGLLSASTEDEAIEWFSLFGSRRRKPTSIETEEVQAIVFGGMGKLRDANCYLLRLPDDKENARKWLSSIKGEISFGDHPPHRQAKTIAFTSTGLERLGLPKKLLEEFPIAFQQGMSDNRRAEFVLGDTGDDNPEKWKWGNEKKVVDVALTIYTQENSGDLSLDKLSEKPLGYLKELGGSVVEVIHTEQLPEKGPAREPFGFIDGISQPVIRGTQRWLKDKESQHVVNPGEFILGYPDNRDYIPTTPTIPATADPSHTLPIYKKEAIDHEWPDLSRTSANMRRDLGRNGSFLVIRQLHQHVDTFNEEISDHAKWIDKHPAKPPGLTGENLETWLKSKLVGRWPDGSSLVRNPFEPASGWDGKKDFEIDNSFLLGSEDPEGIRCPFSAHIRRTNPRESFDPGSQEQLDIVNRHRILRMGRGYKSAKDQEESRGLLFMCLNVDFERQFEFVQQTWVMSRLFHGMYNEVDAVIGRGGDMTIPTSKGPISIQNLKDFITVRGGAYFYMPSHSAIRYLCGMD